MRESAEKHDRSQRPGWIELSVALAALVVAVVSLFIAHHQTLVLDSQLAVMDRQLSATVWPIVHYGSSNLDAAGNPRVTLHVFNSGLGPARIRSFRINYDGQPIETHDQLFRACCMSDSDSGQPPPGSAARPPAGATWSTVLGRVIRADEMIYFLALPATESNRDIFQALDRMRHEIDVRICYCSLLDDCWLATAFGEGEPQPLDSCAAEEEAVQYES